MHRFQGRSKNTHTYMRAWPQGKPERRPCDLIGQVTNALSMLCTTAAQLVLAAPTTLHPHPTKSSNARVQVAPARARAPPPSAAPQQQHGLLSAMCMLWRRARIEVCRPQHASSMQTPYWSFRIALSTNQLSCTYSATLYFWNRQ